MNFAENATAPEPNNPDGPNNPIKMPLWSSGDAVGPIEISVGPEEDIKLGYYESEQ